MTLNKMIELLNSDLANEYSHMMFYMIHGSTLVGTSRQIFSDVFKNHAKSEMSHALEFQDLIVGLGGVPATTVNPIPVFADAQSAIRHAIVIEEEVVRNYLQRLKDVEVMGMKADQDPLENEAEKLRIKLFIEKQFEDSRRDLEEFKNLIIRI